MELTASPCFPVAFKLATSLENEASRQGFFSFLLQAIAHRYLGGGSCFELAGGHGEMSSLQNIQRKV